VDPNELAEFSVDLGAVEGLSNGTVLGHTTVSPAFSLTVRDPAALVPQRRGGGGLLRGRRPRVGPCAPLLRPEERGGGAVGGAMGAGGRAARGPAPASRVGAARGHG
jgi:hypothetical protein